MDNKFKIIITISAIINLLTIIALWLNIYQNHTLINKNTNLQKKILVLQDQIQKPQTINPDEQRDFSSPDENDIFNWFRNFFNQEELNTRDWNWFFIDWNSNLNFSTTTIINWKYFSYNISQNWNKISWTIKTEDKKLLDNIQKKLK